MFAPGLYWIAVLGLVTLLFPLATAFDASLQQPERWQSVSRSRAAWVVGLVIATLVGVGPIAAAWYLAAVRPELAAATRHLAVAARVRRLLALAGTGIVFAVGAQLAAGLVSRNAVAENPPGLTRPQPTPAATPGR